MKNVVIALCLCVFAGCASTKSAKDSFFDGPVFASAVDEGCALACSEQIAMDGSACVSVCKTVADIGVDAVKSKGAEFLNDEQKSLLFEEAFEFAAGPACDAACREQKSVPAEVCAPTCNFLAKTGKDMLKSKLK